MLVRERSKSAAFCLILISSQYGALWARGSASQREEFVLDPYVHDPNSSVAGGILRRFLTAPEIVNHNPGTLGVKFGRLMAGSTVNGLR